MCVLCYDIVAAAQMVGVAQQVTRVSTLAAYGSSVGQWDYWPKVCPLPFPRRPWAGD